MSKGVYIFKGGTDTLIKKMTEELQNNGVEMRKRCLVERILLEAGPDGVKRAVGVRVNGQEIRAKAVLSNANLKTTLFGLVGKEELDTALAEEMEAVRINSGSCQVYLGVREGEQIPDIGDLIFCSEANEFSSNELLDPHTTSRTFSLYYPDTRPHTPVPRYAVVCSVNARWEDWAPLAEEPYQAEKQRICQEALAALEKFVPDIRGKLDWIEAATPRTIHRYVRSWNGTSFGTKFEGLKVSMELPQRIPGLYHAGSVGIIMSGWLGTMNYGVIVASKMDAALRAAEQVAVAV
ncbi:MAG: hypothetical protein B7X06_03915 [Verrucomicrobia bacterium 21-51-4]|nr:MAG: hypothetical protein B7X06_03915 [Verrucomicrobia bacterium 21-51-4]